MVAETIESEASTEAWYMNIPIEYDPQLKPCERTINFELIKSDGIIEVFSEDKTVNKDFINHNYFNIGWIRVGDDDRTWTGHPDTIEPRSTDDLELYAVSGTMPTGCLTVKSAPRTNNYISGVINTEEFDGDVFGDN